MRSVRYSVAVSLDGYIASPDGGYDWIIADDTIDFGAFFRKIDTVVMGRATYEVSQRQGEGGPGAEMRTIVVSRTMRQQDHPDVAISHDAVGTVRALREESGKDIWLMGGGQLFQALFEADLVDLVEVGIMPVLLGQGLPMLPQTAKQARLRLVRHEVFATGIVLLRYVVEREKTL
jgi:dihydrofolate reductase